MDYHLLAILEEPDDSDFDSETEFPTVVSGFSEIQSKGDLINQAKFPDRIFRPGSIRSARLAGDTENEGLIPVEATTQTTTTNSIVTPSLTEASGGIQPTLGAIPRRQSQPKAPKTKKKAPKAPSTPFQGDLDFRDFYVEDQNPAGSYYTPERNLGWTAQFERKLKELFPRLPFPNPPINPDFAQTNPPPYDQIMAEGGEGILGGNGIRLRGIRAPHTCLVPNSRQGFAKILRHIKYFI